MCGSGKKRFDSFDSALRRNEDEKAVRIDIAGIFANEEMSVIRSNDTPASSRQSDNVGYSQDMVLN